MKKAVIGKSIIAAALLGVAASALADVNVGVSLSLTGPAASLGIPEKNTVALLPTTIGGQKVNYIILDDESDTTKAVKNTKKLISEDKVDVIIGSTITPASLAMVDSVAEGKTPMISLAASAKIVEPVDEKRRWVFKTTQNDITMSRAVVDHMVKAGVKTVAFIGFADAYGEGWHAGFSAASAPKGIKLVGNERYVRTDTSVTGQVLKMLSAKPDAILIAASGTPAVLPQKTLKERGFTGRIYQTHGVANADFLRVGGKDVEGTFLPAGPVLVVNQLPQDHATRKAGMEYTAKYEAAHGKGSVSTFGGHAWDAGLILQAAIPVALKKSQPGSQAFRDALRDAIEGIKNLSGAHAVINMTPNDHVGHDDRARVIVKIENGAWKFQP
ncbi:ABC transporter substrate-binding protein [Lacisediminimonas sp.]|uniref:ABC transporter substrate-binding protein n=1 Tax=Lacisediminimonas sp. TaxID=3060582 RepID=UPI0027237C27|nr:ABC transporter substrate-binding protein [Lacisediminimonas sp.]MDO8300204.1 ABC transporter substrate-binding protein [Lacisediminimonas sp.]